MTESTSESKTLPGSAFLIVNSQVFTLDKEMINIGRKLDNHIVIHDSRVSRNHAQLRGINGKFMILDLNSTGGTYVNGQRITKSVLYSGDTLSLSGVPAKFVQDAPRMITSTLDRTGPLSDDQFREPPTQFIPRPNDPKQQT
ncbi:MAG: FHA domain-containing protein [Chloroflexota bacterium]